MAAAWVLQSNSIDLATYLVLHGVYPIAVSVEGGKFRRYTFAATTDTSAIARRYWEGGAASIREFHRIRGILRRLDPETLASLAEQIAAPPVSRPQSA